MHSDVLAGLEATLSAASGLLKREPLASAPDAAPTRTDLIALRTAGRPWTAVAAVAEYLRILELDPTQLARLPLQADPALADRLFHVAVLGVLLRTLRECGCFLKVRSLPGSPVGVPVFTVTTGEGTVWDLWFEAGAAWRYYGVPEPFPSAVIGIAGTGGSLGADLALIQPGKAAFLIECKYSENPTYVGRSGYEQLLAYMTEARNRLAAEVTGILVGPAEIVTRRGSAATSAGTLHVVDPNDLSRCVSDMLNASPAEASHHEP
ncbi:hypothetical protein [Couchioplanes azureus]|uniref:hypothetical protein n=1 Tax=Couchioplanes caeruleus TaxID=56438 RepID=UPI0016703921|nr:hypothetical protein [Couchioplanes caeruleus]